MRSAISGYALALLLSGTVATAQDGSTTTDTKVKSDDGKVVTMDGCVEIGGGTSFLLTNITAERERHEKRSVPPAGSQPIVGRKGLDLGQYIQQKVELTGVVVPAATTHDKQDKIKIKETGSSQTTTVKVPRGAATEFLVASVRVLSPSCQP